MKQQIVILQSFATDPNTRLVTFAHRPYAPGAAEPFIIRAAIYTHADGAWQAGDSIIVKQGVTQLPWAKHYTQTWDSDMSTNAHADYITGLLDARQL